MFIIVSVSEQMRPIVGRPSLNVPFSQYEETKKNEEAVISYGQKKFRGIIHQAKDGLHWTEIVAEVK